MSGSEATISDMLVDGRKDAPTATTVAAHVAAMVADVRARTRAPKLSLSMLSIVISRTLGRRLNSIRATHTPPRAESTTRFSRSVRMGSALTRARYHATCGHRNA